MFWFGSFEAQPDSKWKLSLQRIGELQTLQTDIIESYSRMLKPGGTMVYSTCSIAKAENQDIVKGFLERNDRFQLQEELHLAPVSGGGDGFYAARLQLQS